MNINLEDVIKLSDDRDYVVCSIAKLKNKTYLYLMDTKNHKNIYFCELVEDEVIEITDGELIKQLLPKFYENSKTLFREFL